MRNALLIVSPPALRYFAECDRVRATLRHEGTKYETGLTENRLEQRLRKLVYKDQTVS